MADYRVLLVDDEEEFVSALSERLMLRGIEVDSALNGEEALALMVEKVFEVVILDVMMPGMDGYEVCERLKDDPETAAVPVVFLTARRELDEARVEELGVAGVVIKPFEPDELIELVEKHCGQRQRS